MSSARGPWICDISFWPHLSRDISLTGDPGLLSGGCIAALTPSSRGCVCVLFCPLLRQWLWKHTLSLGTSQPSQVTSKLHAHAGAQPCVWVPCVSKQPHRQEQTVSRPQETGLSPYCILGTLRTFQFLISTTQQHSHLCLKVKPWDFPGGPVAENTSAMRGVWVWSLLGELRCHVSQSK